ADWLVPMSPGLYTRGAVPSEACRGFGPDIPQPTSPGQPPGRPADPDLTGGHLHPGRPLPPLSRRKIRLALEELRIICGLPAATPEILLDFKTRYRANENPVLSKVELIGQGTLHDEANGDPPVHVKAGAKVTFRASWPGCPTVAKCGDGI